MPELEHDEEFRDQAMAAMHEIGLPEDEAEMMLEDMFGI